jgi:small basic protein
MGSILTCLCAINNTQFKELTHDIHNDDSDPEQKTSKIKIRRLRCFTKFCSLLGIVGCFLSAASVFIGASVKWDNPLDHVFFEPISRLGYGVSDNDILCFRIGIYLSTLLLMVYACAFARLMYSTKRLRSLVSIGFIFHCISALGIVLVLVFNDPSKEEFIYHVAGGVTYIAASSFAALFSFLCMIHTGIQTWFHYLFFVCGFCSLIALCITGIPAVLGMGCTTVFDWGNMTSTERVDHFDKTIERAALFAPSQWMFISTSVIWYLTTAIKTLIL